MTYRARVTVVLVILGWSAFADAALAQRAHSGAYELLTPQGAGPFPAVVVMHGCDGISAHTRRWADRLVSWGYAALIVDSFRPRGLTNVCKQGALLPGYARAGDAIAAKAYLQSLPNVD